MIKCWKFLSGVNLWNISGLIGKYPENGGCEYTAARKFTDPVLRFIFNVGEFS
jgi:hypothetical protein